MTPHLLWLSWSSSSFFFFFFPVFPPFWCENRVAADCANRFSSLRLPRCSCDVRRVTHERQKPKSTNLPAGHCSFEETVSITLLCLYVSLPDGVGLSRSCTDGAYRALLKLQSAFLIFPNITGPAKVTGLPEVSPTKEAKQAWK